ncbi:hypothetical protein Cantr_02172 [Candida viswanathii]|uniref:Uncharacterized protein n=1 Tax=Candida viswanathii TaxID=5486 RepID=A0A367YKH9_9ASCO|nr:hypothetical protein Cantr_02172 [Candida viswanathii]
MANLRSRASLGSGSVGVYIRQVMDENADLGSKLQFSQGYPLGVFDVSTPTPHSDPRTKQTVYIVNLGREKKIPSRTVQISCLKRQIQAILVLDLSVSSVFEQGVVLDTECSTGTRGNSEHAASDMA